MVTSKCEILVDFGPKPDGNLVEKAISELKSQDGVNNAEFKNGAIVVDTVLPSSQVISLVSNVTGKRTVLQGFGGILEFCTLVYNTECSTESKSAVAMVSDQQSRPSILGVVRFLQADGMLVADGAIDGLPTGLHGLQIHETGDLSQGCGSLGGVYTCRSSEDLPSDRHVGDLGLILADERGRACFRIEDKHLQMSEIIGRSIAVTQNAINGTGSSQVSKMNGCTDIPIACGIIARSAGVFSNPKRVCQCDGTVVWEERDKPLASERRKRDKCCGKH